LLFKGCKSYVSMDDEDDDNNNNQPTFDCIRMMELLIENVLG